MIDFFELIDWHPTIGDPSFMGWFTVSAYFVTFLLSLKVVSISDHIFARRKQRQKQLWLTICFLLLFLCINKQLDLQSFLTASMRYLLHEWGIHEYKRNLQKIFIGSILIFGLGVFVLIFKQLHQVIKKHTLAVLGIVLLSMFILIRASSFHNIDYFLGRGILGFKMNWLLEVTGIGLVFANGILLIQRKKKILIVRKKKTSIPTEL
ncbi:MAG: hypothetical protein ACJAUP_000842 [Cellvibrionaceae bacterium]